MLDKFIFFVSKQPVVTEISDIHHVVFSYISAGIATVSMFDMQIITKHRPEYMFMSSNKEEHQLTDTFLKDKKVQVKDEMVLDGDLLVAVAGDDLDEDMQSVASNNLVSCEAEAGETQPGQMRVLVMGIVRGTVLIDTK